MGVSSRAHGDHGVCEVRREWRGINESGSGNPPPAADATSDLHTL